jgi:hypothetical protein
LPIYICWLACIAQTKPSYTNSSNKNQWFHIYLLLLEANSDYISSSIFAPCCNCISVFAFSWCGFFFSGLSKNPFKKSIWAASSLSSLSREFCLLWCYWEPFSFWWRMLTNNGVLIFFFLTCWTGFDPSFRLHCNSFAYILRTPENASFVGPCEFWCRDIFSSWSS